MKDCYNGYQELHLNGLELRELFKILSTAQADIMEQ